MQKSSEIVLPAGTKRVDVIDIPTLIAESLYPHHLAIRVNLVDILTLMAEPLPEGSSLAIKLPEKSCELPLDELARLRHVGLYTLAQEHFHKLKRAIVKGELVVFSKVTKSRCGFDDFSNAHVKFADLKTYIAITYEDIDVRLASTQPAAKIPSAEPVVAVGASGDVELDAEPLAASQPQDMAPRPAPVGTVSAPRVIHSTKARRNILTPVIELAQKQCRNTQDTAEVWAVLLVLAEKKSPPLIGATEDGLQYLNKGIADIFKKKSLGQRLAR